MNKIYFLLIVLLVSFSTANAAEMWEIGSPAQADIGQRVSVGHDRLQLHVPESFEGRTANEWRNVFTAEVRKLVRYAHSESRVELRGSATRFDFDYTKDCIDVQVYRSKDLKPGANTCMACHGNDFSRTAATVGYVNQELTPEPYRRGLATVYLNDATSNAFRGEVNHWVNQHMMVKATVSAGTIEQGRHKLDAKSASIGLAGTVWHRMTWSGELNFSKADTYAMRKTFIGKIGYRPFKGLKLSVGGGAFIDGYTQYGTEMSEMGLMSMTLQKDTPGQLPNLFNTLKDDSFGYWQFSAEYEYKF
ncbi:MAG: hypothetical protein A2W80_05300 [Candidatus Riflebacteria bacterium GWC2_50_8]|nr:MAG: hypothetical protein A2W80_05300 [Candidatus Riflebacteria bacterium GWC2_50_8]